MRKKTCKEVINEKLKERIKQFEEVLKLAEESENGSFVVDDCEYEDLIDWINQTALAYSDDLTYRGKKLELSWGGPADGFIFLEDGNIIYYYQDWFDGAEEWLSGHEYEVMKEIFERALNI